MGRELHGLRYLRPGAEGLARFIAEELHKCTYSEALSFYDDFNKWSRERQDPSDIALLGANDRYFLLIGLLNRRDAMHPWLYERCREVEAEPDGCLDLWARYHYKSTMITFAGSIQEMVIDPEITICIFSHTRDIAAKFLFQIKTELETNEALKATYPDVFWLEPRKQSPKWSVGDGITIIRKGNPKEATIEAWGLVDGQPTSKHFRLLIYNDVVTLKSVSPTMVRRTTQAWELSDNLGIGEGTRKWHEGTRYSYGDTYAELIERRIFKVRRYPATHNGRRDGRPVFFSQAHWEHVKKTQRKTVAAQMLQNPAEGSEASFRLEWVKPFEIRPTLLNVYITVDPSGGRKRTSDRCAMIVTGVDVHKNKYFLDGFSHRMKLSDRWKNLKMLHRKWTAKPGVQNVFVGYERYSMQADIEHFENRMEEEKYHFEIVELNWAGPEATSKEDRVNRLQPDIEGTEHKYYFPYYVYSEAQGAVCSWRYDEENDMIATELAQDEQLIRDARTGEVRVIRSETYFETRMMAAARKTAQPWRIAQPIRQIDEEGQIYDLTLRFFEEMAQFPFGQKDDTLDAASRIYDEKMGLFPPTAIERPINNQIKYAD